MHKLGGYSKSTTRRHHHHSHHHHHHHQRRKEKYYIPKEFKKSNPPTFDGDMKKYEDAEAWFLGMKKFFRFHNYSENMKAKITTFSLKGKTNIWWEDVNNVKGIREEELIWDEFERLFKKKYLFERYYDD